VVGIDVDFRLYRKDEAESSEQRLQRQACRKAVTLAAMLDPGYALDPSLFPTTRDCSVVLFIK